jgi:hypothetical protein
VSVKFGWKDMTICVVDILATGDSQQGFEHCIDSLNIGCEMNSAARIFWSDLIDEIWAVSPWQIVTEVH